MSYAIELEMLPRQAYVAARRTVPMAAIGQAMGPLFAQLYGWLGRHGVATAAAPWTRYLMVGTEECELEVAAPVTGDLAGDDEMTVGIRPAGIVARTLHVGSYDRLPDAYQAMSAWMSANGYEAAGAMWECYLTSPDAEPDPQQWKTLVYYPVTRVAAPTQVGA